MTDKIKQALLSLNVSDDNQWTQDGSPRLDTLKIATGNPGLTREAVTAAVPGFSRETAATFAATGTSGVAAAPAPETAPVITPPADTAAPAAPAATTAPEAGSLDSFENLNDAPLTGTDEFRESDIFGKDSTLEGQLESAKEYLSEVLDARSRINAEVPIAQNRIADLENAIAAQNKEDNSTSPIQQYLRKQVELGNERAALRETVEESGVNLGRLRNALAGTPLDEALSGRKRQVRKIS